MVWMYAPFSVGVFLIVIGISFAVYMFDSEARNNSPAGTIPFKKYVPRLR